MVWPLFLDPDFFQHWIDRYQQLRKSVYSLTNLMTQIDCYGDQVREATLANMRAGPAPAPPTPLPALARSTPTA